MRNAKHEVNKIPDPDEDVKNILAIGWAASPPNHDIPAALRVDARLR